MLFKGHCRTSVLGVNTRVNFIIKNNYEVIATFSCQGKVYKFHMKKWAKTSDTVQTPTSSFDFFANLLMDTFSQCNDFGTITVEREDGVEVTTVRRTQAQILNILKYATREVFICTEEIITKYRRSVLDYAIFHRERGKQNTYEQYIHLVACHCLTHAKFHAPNIDYPLVDFCIEEQDFRSDALTGIVADPEDAALEEGEDM